MEHLVIVGGGIAGMTCVEKLKNKFDITLLEAHDKIGGCCKSVIYKENNISNNAIFYANLLAYNIRYRQMFSDNIILPIKDFKINKVTEIFKLGYDLFIFIKNSLLNKLYESNFYSNTFQTLLNFWGFSTSNVNTIIKGLNKNDIYSIAPFFIMQIFSGQVEYIDNINKQFQKYFEKTIGDIDVRYKSSVERIDVDNKIVYFNNTKQKYDKLILTTRINSLLNILKNSNNEDFSFLIHFLSNEVIYQTIWSTTVSLKKNYQDKITVSKNNEVFGIIIRQNLACIFSKKELNINEILTEMSDYEVENIICKDLIDDYSPTFKNYVNAKNLENEIMRIYNTYGILIPLGTLFTVEIVCSSMNYHEDICNKIFL